MAWIESHDTLARHPKTKRLMRVLGVCRAQAIGHLHLLWWWTLDFAQDGDLSAFAADELADAAEWEGDPAAFLAALVAAGFVDAPAVGQQAIHDWEEYAGRLLDQRERNAARQRAYRARQHGDVTPPPAPVTPPPVLRDAPVTSGDLSRNGDISVTSPSRHGATVPDRTVPDLTIPKEDLSSRSGVPPPKREAPPPLVDNFTPWWTALWAGWPERRGKKANKAAAQREARKIPARDRDRVTAAELNFAASKQALDGYAPDLHRFLQPRKDDVPMWQEWETPEVETSTALAVIGGKSHAAPKRSVDRDSDNLAAIAERRAARNAAALRSYHADGAA